MKESNVKKSNHKIVFALWIKQRLKELGFEPILEMDNFKNPGYKCWIYEATPAFLEAFTKVANEKEE